METEKRLVLTLDDALIDLNRSYAKSMENLLGFEVNSKRSDSREETIKNIDAAKFSFSAQYFTPETKDLPDGRQEFVTEEFPYGAPEADESIADVSLRLSTMSGIVLAGRRMFSALWYDFLKHKKESALYRLVDTKNLWRTGFLIFPGTVYMHIGQEPVESNDNRVLYIRCDSKDASDGWFLTWGMIPIFQNAYGQHMMVYPVE